MKPPLKFLPILPPAVAFLLLASIPSYITARQSSTSTLPSYPDTESGFVHFVKDLLKAHEAGNQPEAVERLVQSLALPNPRAWFSEVFGQNSFEPLAQAYAANQASLLRQIDEGILDSSRHGYGEVRVKKYEKTCDDDAGEFTFPLLMSRVSPVPLYELRMMGGNSFRRISTFAYVVGGFRYVGTLNIPDEFARSQTANPIPRVQIKGDVQSAKILKKVAPSYPELARRERLEGTVRLHAIIGKDGVIEQLRVIRGYCSLAEVSVPAVKQWLYTPTLLNCEPVEVDTTIDVIFTLRRH